MPSKTGRTTGQIVAHAYTCVWDFAWTPIRFVAGIFLANEWLPQFAPWIIAARLGRWPIRVERVNDDHYKICRDTDCETCRSLRAGEINVDDELEIKHDPFNLLTSLKRR